MVDVYDAIKSFEYDFTEHGIDMTVCAKDGYMFMPEIDIDGSRVTFRIRNEIGPHVGDTVRYCNRNVTVYDRRFNKQGQLMLQDKDTLTWFPFDDCEGR